MIKKFCVLILTLFILCEASLFADISITPSEDESSAYKPTQIINGTFTDEPFMTYVYNGVTYTSCPNTAQPTTNNYINAGITPSVIFFNGINEGWNTTDIKTSYGNLFEYADERTHQYSVSHNGWTYNTTIPYTDRFVEMNGQNGAVFYQDLTTYPGDVILWSVAHGVVTAQGDNKQEMQVEIGAPNTENGSIKNAHGVGSNINSEIDLASKVTYTASKTTNPQNAILGFAGSDIGNLCLYQNNTSDINGWHKASGVYLISEGQDVTRFAFESLSSNPTGGNLMDDIVFSTLIGNLSATRNSDGSITVRGYWGDSDESKHLCIKFNTDTTATNIVMTGVLNKNFQITIPVSSVPGNATSLDVYHEDYASAKRTVEIVAGYITYLGLENATVTENPSKYYLKTDTFTLNNPTKSDYEFVGWTSTGLSQLSKTVSVEKGTYGDRNFTANWHKHEWVYTTKGSSLIAYCTANNQYSNLCSYHDEEHAVSLFMQAQWNAGLAATIQPTNATNKNVIWSSSDTSILTVDQKGFIHGIKAGEATVTATSTDGSNVSSTCTVTVQ